jgi:hypothetical protein
MLKALNSRQFDVLLGDEQDAPTFSARYLSCAEYSEFCDRQDAARSTKEMCDLIDEPLVGWRNIQTADTAVRDRLRAAGVKVEDDGTIPYQKGVLSQLLTLDEATHLLKKVVSGMRPSEGTLGKSESPALPPQA